MVSNTSDDLPEPETPVTTVRVLCGISKSMFLRLWTRAPRTMMLSFDIGRTVLDPAALRHCGLPTTGFGSTAESFDYKWSNKAGSIALSRGTPSWPAGTELRRGRGRPRHKLCAGRAKPRLHYSCENTFRRVRLFEFLLLPLADRACAHR